MAIELSEFNLSNLSFYGLLSVVVDTLFNLNLALMKIDAIIDLIDKGVIAVKRAILISSMKYKYLHRNDDTEFNRNKTYSTRTN